MPELDSMFLLFILIGFFAQLADGALGMAYGTLSTAILLAMGIPPATVSAGVHTAQFFTAGLSGASHTLLKNIDWKIFMPLAVAGVCGGIIGALFLVHIDTSLIRPWISVYLLFLGIFIMVQFFRKKMPKKKRDGRFGKFFTPVLGFFSGILDAIGGGWGPMVTSNLIARGEPPRYAIGSVNTAEFFVKTAIAITLFLSVGMVFHQIVLGLLIGGVLAAPLGAFVLRIIKPSIMIGMVGGLIVLISLYQLSKVIL